MTFRFLGRLVRRAWPIVLIGWAVLLVGTYWVAPPWAQVAQDRELAFLPADAPSRRAEAKFAEAFPDDHLGSSVVLVFRRTADDPAGLARDKQFIGDVVEPGLRAIADAEGGLAAVPVGADEPLFGGPAAAPAATPARPRSIIARLHTPNAAGAGALLVSPDGRALLVVAELTTEFMAAGNWPTIARIEAFVADVRDRGRLPAGMEVFVTGSAVVGRDHTVAQVRSARATELLTVVLVVGLLILIYRAPLLAVIPLATVVLAVQVTRNLLAILGGAGYVTLFQGIEIYITILAYGAGVDYCLFLTARYQEELGRGASAADAAAAAVTGTGPALAASAATVLFGIGMMAFARFGKFREAGLAIPLSVFLVLAATLTFSPALLRLAGRFAFWPRGVRRAPAGGSAADSPDRLTRAWGRVGEAIRRRPWRIGLVTAAVMAPAAAAGVYLSGRLSYDFVGNLPADAPSVAGTKALGEHFPAGVVGPVTVLVIDPKADFGRPAGEAVIGGLTDRLRADADALGIADVRSFTAPRGWTVAPEAVGDPNVPAEARREAIREAAASRYLTDLGGRAKVGMRLDVVPKDGPFSHGSVAALDRIEGLLREALPPDAQVHLAGPTAGVRDLAAVMRADRRRIEALVLGCVLLVLVVLLRGLAVPLYLLATVLFSYYAALGVAFAVFWALDPAGFAGIDWKVAIFLFTILIAVGEDYNIFLIARVREEQARHGPEGGVTEGLARTGPIISSCGVIMAGTFASLLAGSLAEMRQLGFALAFGVLLDTFVVRPVLVPAFLVILARRPGRGSGG